MNITETHLKIIEAAEKRFQKFGFNKTNISEIAADTNMSPANIYRYFDSKQDIAAACANRCLDEKNNMLRDIIRTPNLTATEKLDQYAMATLHHTFEFSNENPMVNELVENITQKCPELVHEKIQTKHALIVEILAYGNERGEFDVADVIATADFILCALTKFDVPLFMSLYSLEDYETKVRGVVSLLINGLKPA